MSEPRKVLVGTIAKYYQKEEKGFIITDSEDLIYFTTADIPEEGPLEVREGRTVTFTCEEQEGLRPRARNITLLK